MDKSLSIIFTVYNKENYLKKSLDCLYDAVSLLDTPYEIIIVEDCSTDSSYEILKDYSEKPCTTILRNDENKGHFQTKCRGYLTSKNAWILTIDGDDYVDKEYIKELVDAVKEDTYLLLARNNKVLTTKITDSTLYWSVHNLPFIIFRRELIVNHIEYYSAPLPKSAWDDCIIITPLYCQVTEMVDAGNKNALMHYKNTYKYNVNYTHSNEELAGIAKATLEKGIQLMKHLSEWTVKTGYLDKYYRFLIPVLTQYLGVFSVGVHMMRPFVREIHPRKDNSIVVVYEYTDRTKELKDHRQLNSQLTFINDTYFSYSFTDTIRYLYLNDLIKNRPVLRISGDCNYIIAFIDDILEKLKDKEFIFDCAGYTYKRKGITYLDYSKPVLYNDKFLKIIANSPSPIAVQEAMRLGYKLNTVSLNDLYDRAVYSKSGLDYSLTYIPKLLSKLRKPIEHIIQCVCKLSNMKDMPIFYVKDDSHTDEKNTIRLKEFEKAIPKEILPVTLDALKELCRTETNDEPWLILTYNMDPNTCIKVIAAAWQLTFDKVQFSAITHVQRHTEKPNRMKIYVPLTAPVNILTHGGIVKNKSILVNDNVTHNGIYQAI